jgi:hypothetical protein
VVVPTKELDLGSDRTVYPGDTVMLDAGEGWMEYLWNTGGTDRMISIPSDSVGQGILIYSVRVTDQNQCSKSDSVRITIADNTRISTEREGQEVKVFPNPTFGAISIICPPGVELGSCRLYSLAGQLLKTIDPRELPHVMLDQQAGSYLLELRILYDDREFSRIRKIVIR